MLKLDDGYVEILPASQVRPLLQRELKNAYHIFATVAADGGKRMIAHRPASHASATKFPWPLSKLAMHDVEINYLDAKDHIIDGPDGKMKSKRYPKERIDEAIEEFLSGVSPNEEVQVNVKFS